MSYSAEDLEQADLYVAIADFEAAESTNISLTAGQYVQVCPMFKVMLSTCIYAHVTT